MGDIREGSLERGRQMRVGWSKMEIFASFDGLPAIAELLVFQSYAPVKDRVLR